MGSRAAGLELYKYPVAAGMRGCGSSDKPQVGRVLGRSLFRA